MQNNLLKNMQLKNKKVLVTGGAGFIGSHTVDALINKGAKVVVVDNLSTGRKENLNPEYFQRKNGASPRAKFYKLNIKSPKIEEIIKKEKPEIVYHFAFFVSVPESTQNPMLDMDCLIGSVRMLMAVNQLKVFDKFIFASSGFLYGNSQTLPHKETSPIDPISSYIVTKKTVENYLQFFKEVFGIPYVVMRYATVYGPRQVKGAMADYIRKLSADKQADIWGDGKKTRDYVFIEDVVNANLMALGIDKNHPIPIFNIGTGIETTLNDLYKKIADLLKKESAPNYFPDRPGELLRFALDFSKIKKELNWQAKISLDQGLKKLLATKNK
jgi:UDP-glucose 4-epimerase